MKQISIWFSILIFAITARGQFVVPGPVSAGNATNFYPNAYGAEILGGSKQVADTNAMNAIPTVTRTVGMTCWVVSQNKQYRLIGGTANTNWVVDSIAGPLAIPTAVDPTPLGLDSNAVWYCSQVGITNYVDVAKVSGCISWLKKAGLYSHLLEARFERTNLNGGTLQTFFGSTGTNVGAVPIDINGSHFNNSAQALSYPIPGVTTHSIYAGVRGSTNEPATSCILSLTTSGGIQGAGACLMGFNAIGATEQLYTRQGGSPQQINGWFDQAFTFSGYYTDDPRFRTIGYGYNAATPAFTPYSDGRIYISNITASVQQITSPMTVLTEGARYLNASTLDTSWVGQMTYWLLFDIPAMTAQQAADVETACRYLDPWTKNRLFVGDSLTAWISQDVNATPTPYRGWPTIITELVSTNDDYRSYNVAQSGMQAAGWALNLPYLQQYGVGGPVKGGIAYVLLGVNDAYLGIGSSGTNYPAATFFQNLSNVWSTLKLDGFTVIGSTISCVWSNPATAFPVQGFGAWNQFSAMENARTQYNGLIISNSFLIDELRPLHQLFSLDDMNTNLATSISRDGLHFWKDGGAASYGPGPQKVAALMVGAFRMPLLPNGAGWFQSTNYYTNNFPLGSIITDRYGNAYSVNPATGLPQSIRPAVAAGLNMTATTNADGTLFTLATIGGGGGGASNAVSIISSNGVPIGTGVTNFDIYGAASFTNQNGTVKMVISPGGIVTNLVGVGGLTLNTISNFSTITFTNNVQASPWNAYGDGVHDDSAAIQACINATFPTNGNQVNGAIYFPNGHYLLTNAPSATYHSQLYIAGNTTPATGNALTVLFLGQAPGPGIIIGSLGSGATDTNGACIISTMTNIGAAILAADNVNTNSTGISSVALRIENMTFALPVSSPSIGINMTNAADFTWANLAVKPTSYPSVSQPWNPSSYGIIMPSRNSGNNLGGDRAEIMGFGTGMTWGEHGNFGYINIVNCSNGVALTSTDFGNNCKYVSFSGTRYCMVGPASGVARVEIDMFENARINSVDWRSNVAEIACSGNIYGHIKGMKVFDNNNSNLNLLFRLPGVNQQLEIHALDEALGTWINDQAVNANFWSRGKHDYFFDNNASAGWYSLMHGRGTDPSTIAALQNGDQLGYYGWGGYDGLNWTNTAWLGATVSGSVGVGSIPTTVSLAVAANQSAATVWSASSTLFTLAENLTATGATNSFTGTITAPTMFFSTNSGAAALDFASGEYQFLSIAGDTTLTGPSHVDPTLVQTISLLITNSDSATHTLTLPASWYTTDGLTAYTVGKGANTNAMLTIVCWGQRVTNAAYKPFGH